MTAADEDLPAHIIAALHAPPGTSVEDIRRRFPPAQPDFAVRYDEAMHAWQALNGWVEVPDAVARDIAEQLRR